jgi:hypothetical protein
VTTDEHIADLNRRIAQVEAGLATLRQELSAIGRATPAFLKVQELIEFGERSVGELRSRRAKLSEQISRG